MPNKNIPRRPRPVFKSVSNAFEPLGILQGERMESDVESDSNEGSRSAQGTEYSEAEMSSRSAEDEDVPSTEDPDRRAALTLNTTVKVRQRIWQCRTNRETHPTVL